MGVLNTFAQASGATALAVSGYLGIALSSSPGNTLQEYRGIWMVGIAGSLGTAAAGMLLAYWVRRRMKYAVAGVSDRPVSIAHTPLQAS